MMSWLMPSGELAEDSHLFSGKDDLFDLDTFSGRFSHFKKMNHTRNLLHSNEQLLEYQKNIDQYIQAQTSKFTNRQLWEQHYVVKSNVHPETKEPIPILFRYAGFVPYNIPIIFGISMLPATPRNQMISQTINQTYNFALNICNASASNPLSNQELAISYFSCCAAAIGVSVGFRKFLLGRKSQNLFTKGLIMITPYLAVTCSNSINQYCARYKDLANGFEVIHPKTGEIVKGAKSVKAGYAGFGEN
jgi:hypothetical protein